MKDRYEELLELYQCESVDDEAIKIDIDNILAEHFAENASKDVYAKCLNLIDLTSLNSTDTEGEIVSMVEKVNHFRGTFPHLSNVAAICVYPALIPAVKSHLTEENVGIASVAAGFPSSQTFIEVKIAETSMVVNEGASEVDVVISVGKFLEGNYGEVYEELSEIKAACRNAHLKVILETGALKNSVNIKKAAILAMSAGADFVKTSTGKIQVSATLEATYIISHAIKEWYEKTGQKIGYKPAGGISTTEEAVKHYTLVKHILGEEWLNNRLFRFGASRLANHLLSSIEGKEIKYF